MGRVITLTTDFGLRDHYVAAVKGAILTVNPEATIVDISHGIAPQRIEQGAFVLGCAFPYFPVGTIHVAVVDPGVGTERREVALVSDHAVFIGPDNGVLSAALPDAAREASGGDPLVVELPAAVRAFSLTKRRFHRVPVSPTFHARDIFGPVAAHLSLGVPVTELGPRVSEIVALPAFRAAAGEDGSLMGRVIHIDSFGNVITNVGNDQLAPTGLQITVGQREIPGLARTYGEHSSLSAIIGSCGFLEIAMSGGSAEQELGVAIGDPVTVRPV